MVALKGKVHCHFYDNNFDKLPSLFFAVFILAESTLWSNNSLLTNVLADPEEMSILLFSIVR